jgi:hypothetical protein
MLLKNVLPQAEQPPAEPPGELTSTKYIESTSERSMKRENSNITLESCSYL